MAPKIGLKVFMDAKMQNCLAMKFHVLLCSLHFYIYKVSVPVFDSFGAIWSTKKNRFSTQTEIDGLEDYINLIVHRPFCLANYQLFCFFCSLYYLLDKNIDSSFWVPFIWKLYFQICFYVKIFCKSNWSIIA